MDRFQSSLCVVLIKVVAKRQSTEAQEAGKAKLSEVQYSNGDVHSFEFLLVHPRPEAEALHVRIFGTGAIFAALQLKQGTSVTRMSVVSTNLRLICSTVI